MTLILLGLLALFSFVVFVGSVVEMLATMNGWGFLTLLVISGYFLWKSYRRNRSVLQWRNCK